MVSIFRFPLMALCGVEFGQCGLVDCLFVGSIVTKAFPGAAVDLVGAVQVEFAGGGGGF